MDWRPFWEEGDPNPNATPDAPPPPPCLPKFTLIYLFSRLQLNLTLSQSIPPRLKISVIISAFEVLPTPLFSLWQRFGTSIHLLGMLFGTSVDKTANKNCHTILT